LYAGVVTSTSFALINAVRQNNAPMKAAVLPVGYGGDLSAGGEAGLAAAKGTFFTVGFEPVEMHTAATEQFQTALRAGAGVTGRRAIRQPLRQLRHGRPRLGSGCGQLPIVYQIRRYIVRAGSRRRPAVRLPHTRQDDLLMASQHPISRDALYPEPYLDVDEWRPEPVRHRYVHGGFAGSNDAITQFAPDRSRPGGVS
jgi:hypothetical protein